MKPNEILKGALHRKQLTNPRYSIRALARDLGLSSSYLSAVLNGKKPVPLARVEDFGKRLEMDELALNNFKRSITIDQVPEAQRNLLSTDLKKLLAWTGQVRQVSKSEIELWNRWYYVATLDLSTCKNFVSDPKWIARRLKISTGDAVEAIDFLLKHNFLIEIDGRWQKNDLHLRYPTSSSRETIRKFHQQYMLKAIEVMQTQTTPEEFAKRLIIGAVVASNPEKIAEARRRLEEVLIEVSQILLEGESTELYQLGIQLYPLTSN